MKFSQVLASGLILAGFASCTETEPPADIGYSYFPAETGRYYVYQVDSVFVDCEFGVRDTFSYQVKEYYDTVFTDGTGENAIRLEVYRRQDASDNWTITDVWSLKKSGTRVEKTEENNRYVKMAFPVEEGAEWDGNAFNYITDWGDLYMYDAVDVPFSTGSYLFDSTVTVTQKYDSTLIYKEYFAETFARNVGMVHKVKISVNGIVDLPEPSNDCDELLNGQIWTNIPIMNRIANGYVVYYRLIDYGFE